MSSVFERMMNDFSQQDSETLLEKCMSFNPGETKKIPLRYRLIALGFVRQMSLEELNEKLTEAGCEKLYARNFMEASLIFAFSKKMSYEKWKELQSSCKDFIVLSEENRKSFSGQNISCAELKSYVEQNSMNKDEGLYTRQLTRYLEADIRNLSDDEGRFRQFLTDNIHSFSGVREKARYYFCKYLYYYVSGKIERYLTAIEQGEGKEQALSELLVLKGISSLRRKSMTLEEAKDLLEQASLSCGNLYDAFNYYYFEYVSSDWMEVLLDYYGGNIMKLPSEQRRKLAQSLRAYYPKWKSLSDDQIIEKKWQEMQKKEEEMDRVYALDSVSRGYQKNRSGEKSVRNYIKGNVDIDRTTLICYLIFFGSDIDIEESQMISVKRLNYILAECGFPRLREKDEFDCFVMEYMKAEDPVDYLMEAVTQYAFANRNFFLYHMYQESVSNEVQFEKLLKTDSF